MTSSSGGEGNGSRVDGDRSSDVVGVLLREVVRGTGKRALGRGSDRGLLG